MKLYVHEPTHEIAPDEISHELCLICNEWVRSVKAGMCKKCRHKQKRRKNGR